jgi:hypothetical protein
MNENTQDLSMFGYRELDMAGDLLKAMANGKKHDDLELGDEIKLEFNPNSGEVFLVDEDYNVAMLADGQLENWISCSYCGAEGFKSEFTLDENGNCKDCKGK